MNKKTEETPGIAQDCSDAKLGNTKRKAVLYAFLLIWYFSPASYAVPSSVFSIWKVVICVVSVGAIIAYLMEERLSLQWFLFIGFFFCFYALSSFTAQSDGSLTTVVYNFLKAAGFITLCFYGIRKDQYVFLQGFALAGCIMCVVNFATVVIYAPISGGMKAGTINFKGKLTNQNWFFFSHDNGTLFYYLPVLAALFSLWLKNKNRKLIVFSVVFYVATLAMYIYLASATACVIVFLLGLSAVYVWIFSRKGTLRFPNYFTLTFVALLISVIVVFFSDFAIYQYISSVFGKNGSVSDRANVWQNALAVISQYPIFGVGVCDSYTDIARLTYDHAHNVVLQVLYQGGIVAAIFFVTALFCVGKDRILKTRLDSSLCILAITNALILAAGSMDFYIGYVPEFFPVIAFALLAFSNSDTPSSSKT